MHLGLDSYLDERPHQDKVRRKYYHIVDLLVGLASSDVSTRADGPAGLELQQDQLERLREAARLRLLHWSPRNPLPWPRDFSGRLRSEALRVHVHRRVARSLVQRPPS